MDYLAGDLRDRVTELREQRGWTRAELANMVGIDPSRMGRIESGETRRVGDDLILSLARVFGVSTDFLLGVSDDPEPNNYDIKALGLSVEAAKQLYTGAVDADVLNILLENPKFGALTGMIARYWSGAAAAGYAAQSELFNQLTQVMAGITGEDAKAAADAVRDSKPSPATELLLLQNSFTGILREGREDVSDKQKQAALLTRTTVKELLTQLKKQGGGRSLRQITAGQMADAIVRLFADSVYTSEEMNNDLRTALVPYFTRPARRKRHG